MNASLSKTREVLDNPFFHRGPIRERGYFFGRTKEIRQALLMLRHNQCISIVGPRRIGKSSFLFQFCEPKALQAYGLEEEFLFVYIDCITLGNLDKTELFQWLWQESKMTIAERERVDNYPDEISDFGDLRAALLRLHQNGYALVFMLDEFETVALNPYLDQDLFSDLRSLSPNVVFVTASHDTLYNLTYANKSVLKSPFFNIFHYIHIGPLSPLEAEEMVFGLLKKVGQENFFDREDLSFAFQVGGYFPFFLQLACYYLFEYKIENEHLQAADYASVLLNFSEHAEAHFDYIWKNLNSDERVALQLVHLGKSEQIDSQLKRRLERKCLLSEGAIFSSVFEGYIGRQVTQPQVIETPKIKVEVEKQLTPTCELAREFFKAAGFDLELGVNNRLWVKIDIPEWRDAGRMPVYCFEEGEPVTGNEISKLTSKVTLETVSYTYAFIIFHERLVDGAAGQLWRFRQKGDLIIIPVHTADIKQTLLETSREHNEAYWKLVALKRHWSILSDPYISLNSLADPQWFFGKRRQRIVRDILSDISSGVNYTLVYGMRRVGKTTLLNQLALACRTAHYPVAKILLKPLSAQYTYAEVLSEIIREWGTDIENLFPDFAMPSPGIMVEDYSQNTTSQFKNDVLELVKAIQLHTGRSTKLVLILDEIDQIFPNQQSPEEAYRQFCHLAQIIKSVIEAPDQAGLVSVVAAMEYHWINSINHFPGNKRFKNPLYWRFECRTVEFLQREDWDDMVQTVGELAGLEYTTESLDALYYNSSGHPDITRKICSCLVELRDSNVITSPVSKDDVTLALDYFLDGPGNHAYYLETYFWNDLFSTDLDTEQRLMEKIAKKDKLSKDVLLFELLNRYSEFIEIDAGSLPSDGELSAERERLVGALHRLVDLQIVIKDEQDFYTISIPIFKDWIRQEILGIEAEYA